MEAIRNERNPTFEIYEEYVQALPGLVQISERYCTQSWALGVNGEDVKARILLRFERHWDKIPRARGQATYISRIFQSSFSEELRNKLRSVIAPAGDRGFDHGLLERLSCSSQVLPQTKLDLASAMDALGSLRPKLGYRVDVLRDREILEDTFEVLSERYGRSPGALRLDMHKVKELYRERFPHFRELVEDF